MHIALIADEAYTVGLAAALQSVLESLHCFNRPADIWIIDLGLSQQSQRRLLEMASAFRSGHAREPYSSSSSSRSRSSSQQQQQRQVQAESNLHIITPTPEQLHLDSLMPDVQHYASNATWAKLLLPDLLPAAAEDGSGLLLYLDCDVIVSPGTDLGELWESARESLCQSVCKDSTRSQPCLAAVRDFGLPCGHTQLAHLGWPDPTAAAAAAAAADPDPIATTTAAAGATAPVYFNAGVLVLHLPRYKASILPRLQGLQHSSSRGGSGADIRSNVAVGDFWSSLKYADQDFLNVMCHEAGSFTELAPKWNVQGIGSYLNHRTESQSPDKPKLFDNDQAAELQNHPAIIHFTGTPHPAPSDLLNPWVTVPTKPWAYVCNHPHKNMWYDLLDKTPWSGSSTDQAEMESATVDELHQFTHLLEEHCRSCNATESSSSSNRTFNKQHFLQSVGQQLCAAAAAESGSIGLSEPSHTSAESSQLQHDDHDQEVHPVFQGFKDPVNPNITLADVSLNPSAGFAFTKVWFDPHAPYWEKYILPRLLPGSKSPNTSSSSGSSATKPLRVLEIGLWEGRSSCYILMKIADHPDAKLVCIDPFDKLYTQFYANRVAWLRNVAAAGGLGPPAAELVSRATRSGLAVAAAAGTAGGSSTSSDEVQNSLVSPPAPLSADVTESLYHTAVSGSSKVQLMHESSRTALPKLLLALHNQQQQPAAGQAYDTPLAAGQATAAAEGVKQAEHAITSCQFDLIYIDGSHMRTDVLFDAVTSWPLLKPGGLLVFDDYEWNEYRDNTVCHPKEGIDAFLQVHAHEFELIHKHYQVVLQKTKA